MPALVRGPLASENPAVRVSRCRNVMAAARDRLPALLGRHRGGVARQMDAQIGKPDLPSGRILCGIESGLLHPVKAHQDHAALALHRVHPIGHPRIAPGDHIVI